MLARIKLSFFMSIVFIFSVGGNTVKIVANIDIGYGNALFISGENALLGNWQKAFRLKNLKKDTWEYEAELPQGSKFKLVKGPWNLGDAIHINVSDENCGFSLGDNQIISGNNVTLKPKINDGYNLASCANVLEKSGKNINFYNILTHQCLSDAPTAYVSHCTFKSDQQFVIEDVPGQEGIYNIKNLQNLCLEVEGASKSDNAYVHMAPCTGGKNQQIAFRISPNDSMHNKIVFLHSNKCLDVFGRKPFHDAKMYQFSCHKEISQDFFINRSVKKVSMPQIIWSFWDKGEAGMPAFYRANVKYWEKILNTNGNSKWKIVVLNDIPGDKNYYGNVVNKQNLPSQSSLQSKIGTADFEQKLKAPVIFSDFVRLEVLYEHGGVWLDPSIMLHESLYDFASILQMANFSLTGYSSKRQANPYLRYADSLENFFLMALPKSTVVKVWKENFRRYWDTKKPNIAIENQPMYSGKEGAKIDVSRFGNLKDYLNQHLALKYTLEKEQSLLSQIFIIGDVTEKERGPFTLLHLINSDDKKLLNMQASQFDNFLRDMQGVVMSKFASVDSFNLRQKEDIKYFFDKGNIFGRLNNL